MGPSEKRSLAKAAGVTNALTCLDLGATRVQQTTCTGKSGAQKACHGNTCPCEASHRRPEAATHGAADFHKASAPSGCARPVPRACPTALRQLAAKPHEDTTTLKTLPRCHAVASEISTCPWKIAQCRAVRFQRSSQAVLAEPHPSEEKNMRRELQPWHVAGAHPE